MEKSTETRESELMEITTQKLTGLFRQMQELQFDRILGNQSAPASILYADITSPSFGKFHQTLVKTAREGKSSYRVRHRKSLTAQSKPLIIPGYGVELALKRTDYIVIDDREDDDSKSITATPEKEVTFEDEEFADLKPLSSSELFGLGLKASSFIMQSENPLDTLVKLSQDFPKYSSALASNNASAEFIAEHNYNRAQLVPGGYNIWWMNGVQLIERQIEALEMLNMLRKERKLINGVTDLGLSGQEAIQLLSHNEVSTAKAESDAPRFDWRDEIEGGNVIIWMNDIEKDKRYADWPKTLQAVSTNRDGSGAVANIFRCSNARSLGNCHLFAETASSWLFLLILQRLKMFCL
jgi:UDP-glucose:glycoprotein glucosyltransferase